MGWIRIMFVFLRSLLRSQAVLAAENLALRQQLAVLSEQKRRPRLRKRDRIFGRLLRMIIVRVLGAIVARVRMELTEAQLNQIERLKGLTS